MRKNLLKLLSLVTVFILSISMFAACGPTKPEDGPGDEPETEEEVLAGVTEDTIWVGNTAGTTGALSAIGKPFNLGIEAAFAAYNAGGGFQGKSVKLKHYDDGGNAENSLTYLDRLIYEDQVFAIVGNFGSYAVDVNLDELKAEKVPMVYAAAGNDSLFNENAQGNDRYIFPVQPLNTTEGKMLVLRAFAPADKGGLGAQKLGVIYSTADDASKSIYKGIEAEVANLPEAKKSNVHVQSVASGDYSAAVDALKEAGCDVVVVAVIGADYLNCLSTMASKAYYCKVLTTYNNSNAALFNDATTTILKEQYLPIFSTMAVFAQSWLDITSTTYKYNTPGLLLESYKALGLATADGMAGFNAEYWTVAEHIFNYALTVDASTAFLMSFDSYALAGYIAGNLFCQGLTTLDESGMALTRSNFVLAMEAKEYQIPMGDIINYDQGVRTGVQSFGLTSIFDSYAYGLTAYHTATSATVGGLVSIKDFRNIIAQ